MDRDTIISKLREIAPALQERYRIARVGLFGSLARGDAGPASDVDVLIRFADDSYTMMDMARVAAAIEEAIGHDVDLLVEHDDLRPSLRRALDRDLIRVA